MSGISGIGSGLTSPYSMRQNLFNEIDTTGSGSITKAELETAVTKAGGTTAAADALYAQLDPNNTGSVTEQQFGQNLPAPPFGGQMAAQMIGFQADGWPGPGSSNAAGSFAQNMFDKIDTDGDGSISKSELESAVTAAGGTAAAADAFYAQLDPNNTGSVSEQQFANALEPPSPTGTTAQDAIAALIDQSSPSATVAPNSTTANASSSGTASDASTTSSNTAQSAIMALMSQLGARNSADGTGQSGADGLFSLFATGTGFSFGTAGGLSGSEDPLLSTTAGSGTGLASSSSSGSTAQDAVLALLQASQSSSSNSSSSASTSNSGALNLMSVVAFYQSQFDQQLSSSLSSGTSTVI